MNIAQKFETNNREMSEKLINSRNLPSLPHVLLPFHVTLTFLVNLLVLISIKAAATARI